MTVRRMGTRLRALRKWRGWTQADLATRAGLHRVFIAQLEGGHKDPSLTTLEKLAKALRVRVSRLIE
jgi:transcriptional regulator with XRE-family HTH domain